MRLPSPKDTFSRVISLPSRPDRLQKFHERWGKDIPTFPALSPDDLGGSPKPPGWVASLASHLAVAKMALAEEAEVVWVFEDDAVPGPDFYGRLEEAQKHLPPNWDVFNAGGVFHQVPTQHIGGPIFKGANLNHTWIECYAMSRDFLEIWVPILTRQLEDRILFADTCLEHLQSVIRYYTVYPSLVYQERAWSDNHHAPCWVKPDGYSPVPGWFKDEEGRAYLDLLRREGVNKHVEVGVHLGRSLAWIGDQILSKPEGEIWAVDAWENLPKTPHFTPVFRKDAEWYMWKMGLWRPNLHVVQGSSFDVGDRWTGPKLDSVFIDAAHDLLSVQTDLDTWTPNVREGGLICGHDYGEPQHPDVKIAVDKKFGGHVQNPAGTFWWVPL